MYVLLQLLLMWHLLRSLACASQCCSAAHNSGDIAQGELPSISYVQTQNNNARRPCHETLCCDELALSRHRLLMNAAGNTIAVLLLLICVVLWMIAMYNQWKYVHT